MKTLLEMLPLMESLGSREAIRFDDGFRRKVLSYRTLLCRIAAASARLEQGGFGKGDRLVFWGENHPDWVVAFWACVSCGIQVVAVDGRSSARFVRTVIEETGARALLRGETAGLGEGEFPIETHSFGEFLSETDANSGPPQVPPLRGASSDDIVEIAYTSGTSGPPKGVAHRHRNLCANLEPFAREIRRYRVPAFPFQPIRILQMLPLSHMFGQAMGLFIPVFLGGGVCFTPELRPGSIIELIRRNRVSVLAVVPRLLGQLRSFIEERHDLDFRLRWSGVAGVAERWWKARRVHRLFGWKFWAIVVGGASVKPEMEEFWSRLGMLLVQGYGLTEASPVVAVNHPFSTRRGSLGKIVEGQEVKIAEDGEILVRGRNVVEEAVSRDGREEGWLHTGDLGEIDGEGRLYFKGRKKDLIVTSEGLNVHPEEVEEVLNRHPDLAEGVVVGIEREGNEVVHAVLLLRDPEVSGEDIIRWANRRLESRQRIRSWSIWSGRELPRTPSTLKVIRSEVARKIQEEAAWSRPASRVRSGEAGLIEGLLDEVGIDRPALLSDRLRLAEDLGISSLDRVELLSRLERALATVLDEDGFARISTVGELRAVISAAGSPRSAGRRDPSPATVQSAEKPSGRGEGDNSLSTTAGFKNEAPVRRYRYPRWTRSLPIRWLRRLSHQLLILPLFRHFLDLSIRDMERLPPEGPVIFASNHASHLDTIAVFAALPAVFRFRLSPAVRMEYFGPYFRRTGGWSARLRNGFQYLLAGALFNTYPIPQRMGGIRKTLAYTGELLDQGYCPLVFPEGRRTQDGKIQEFQSGIGLMAVRLQVPVVPVHLQGLFEILPPHARWPGRGAVRVRFGIPLRFGPAADYREAALQVEKAVRELEGADS